MNILSTILQSGLSDNLINSMASKTGLDTGSIGNLVKELAPQLVNGAKANLDSDNDSSELIDMISKTDIEDIANNPEKMDDMDTSGMLGQLFNSLNENEEDVVSAASEKSGLDLGSISSLLPMLAPLVMGALNKQTNLGSQDTSDTGGITSMLTNFIDKDNDGSIVDDLFDMAKKFV